MSAAEVPYQGKFKHHLKKIYLLIGGKDSGGKYGLNRDPGKSSKFKNSIDFGEILT